MFGEIGALFLGDQQIAGFYDWTIEVTIDGERAKCRATAERYWILVKTGAVEALARFYTLSQGNLLLLQEVPVTVDLDGDLGVEIRGPLVMKWMN